jgi:hypothetical protein
MQDEFEKERQPKEKKLGFGLSPKNWPTCFFKAKLYQVIKGYKVVSSGKAHPFVCRRQNCIESYTEVNSLGSGQSLPTNTIKLADQLCMTYMNVPLNKH